MQIDPLPSDTPKATAMNIGALIVGGGLCLAAIFGEVSQPEAAVLGAFGVPLTVTALKSAFHCRNPLNALRDAWSASRPALIKKTGALALAGAVLGGVVPHEHDLHKSHHHSHGVRL